DRAPWPGAPGFADGPDADDVDVPRSRGPQGPDVDLPSHPQRPTPGGDGPTRHTASEPGPPPHARGWGPDGGAHSHGARSLTPGAAPLEPSLQALARELQQLPPSVIRQLSH